MAVTMSIALLLLRLGIGLTMVGHGVKNSLVGLMVLA